VVDCGVNVPEVPGLMPGTVATLLALTDAQTPVWWGEAVGPGAPASLAAAWLGFHTGAPPATGASAAHFVVCGLQNSPLALGELSAGSDVSPEHSATLLLELPGWHGGPPRLWQGPGIREPLALDLPVRDPSFWQQWADNGERFPSGVDVLMVCGRQLLGLPRTTLVKPAEER
jgi:alpha-D-ribose 1-methylphosphonate 5-triphosphate synthase subunit PhnH